MGGDSGGSTSSNTTSNPWVGVQDPMLDVISQAGNLYSQPYQAYQGQTIAGPSDSTVMGQNLAYQRAALGAPDLNAARGYAADLSGGAFMGGNPTANNAWLGNTASGQNIGNNPWLYLSVHECGHWRHREQHGECVLHRDGSYQRSQLRPQWGVWLIRL